MTATYEDISGWLTEAYEQEAAFLIIAHDHFDHDNYPVFCHDESDFWSKYLRASSGSMQSVDEVYDMSKSIAKQRKEHRSMNLPQKETR